MPRSPLSPKDYIGPFAAGRPFARPQHPPKMAQRPRLPAYLDAAAAAYIKPYLAAAANAACGLSAPPTQAQQAKVEAFAALLLESHPKAGAAFAALLLELKAEMHPKAEMHSKAEMQSKAEDVAEDAVRARRPTPQRKRSAYVSPTLTRNHQPHAELSCR